MARVIQDRTTRFSIPPGGALEVRIMDPELQVWSVKMEDYAPDWGDSVVDIHLTVTRK